VAINLFLDPIREKRASYAERKGFAEQIIFEGTLRMREEGKETLALAKKAMGLAGVWNRISRKAQG